MEERIAEFIAGLRAAGVRISIAESEDAFRAVQKLGVSQRGEFQSALRATLIKEAGDQPTFERLFPLYFGSGGPPLDDVRQDLSPEEQRLLERALQSLMERLRRLPRNTQSGRQSRDGAPAADQGLVEALMQLLQWLLRGTNPTPEQLDEMVRQAEQAGLGDPARDASARRMMRQMAELLQHLLKALADTLAQMGMSPERIEKLMAGLEANRQALAEQVAHHLGAAAARRQAAEHPHARQDVASLMERPFADLSEREAELLRDQVRRLAAQLRSRAALRRKRGKRGTLDVKKMLRTNLRYDGVPLEMQFRTRHLKPKLLLICDVSTSMRPVVDFLLRLIYELQDQVASAHSFAFIDDLEDIGVDFAEHPPQVAIREVLRRLPPGHYNTDLGYSLNTLMARHADTIDGRTTVILVGDGRNNYNDPRLDLMEQIRRRAKRIVWLNPEAPYLWGTGDSDMPAYLPYVQAVHRVSNLAELTAAVDKLLSDRQ